MPRYLIIGCSGSGKSTLAQQISTLCGVPYINTDALYWNSDWTVIPEQEVIDAIDLEAENYVLDGNFVSHRGRVWHKADVIIWLNYDLPLVLYRLLKRNMGWWLTRSSPWTGTPISLHRVFSGLRHSYQSHGKKRDSYPAYLASLSDKEIHIVSRPKEVEALLESLTSRS